MYDRERFHENIQLFSRFSPEVALRLSHVDPCGVVFCTARSGESNLKYSGSYVHSNYSPINEAERWFGGLNLNGINVLYVYGVGLGYYYDAAKKWLGEDAGRYLVFLEDNSAVLCRLFETEKGTQILHDKQVQLHYFESYEKIDSMISWLVTFFVLMDVEVSVLDHYRSERVEVFDKIRMRIMQESLSIDSYSSESMRGGRDFFKNFYYNMGLLHESYHGNKLFGKFKNVPAIICGAGPSLNKNLSVLKGLSDRALILAGGSSVNALSKNGIMPHFGGGIDPNPPQYDRIITNYAYETPYFYRNRMYHDALKAVHGPRLYINGSIGYPVSDWFENKLGIEGKILEEGHNIINHLIEVANALGCNPIIFAGMDLAYSGMDAYASGVVGDSSVSEDDIVKSHDKMAGAFVHKDIYGSDVYTLWKWVGESTWISDYAESHKNTTFVNATEGGIGFDGIVNASLVDVAGKFLPRRYDMDSLVHTAIQGSVMPHVTSDSVRGVLNDFYGSMKRSISLCDDILGEIEKMDKKIRDSDCLPALVQTGKCALYEIELNEEPAYMEILARISETMTMTLQRRLSMVNYDETICSDRERRFRELFLNAEKLRFVKNVAELNIKELEGMLNV